MVETTMRYDGGLRCSVTHGPSKATLTTDAPKDNHGKGESFSPTDLVGVALGSCILTTMGIAAAVLQADMTGATVTVTKEMAAKPMRRIARLGVTVDMPIDPPDAIKQKLIHAAEHCPVHHSLHPDVELAITFSWASGR